MEGKKMGEIININKATITNIEMIKSLYSKISYLIKLN